MAFIPCIRAKCEVMIVQKDEQSKQYKPHVCVGDFCFIEMATFLTKTVYGGLNNLGNELLSMIFILYVDHYLQITRILHMVILYRKFLLQFPKE